MQYITSDKAPAAFGPFSQAVEANGFIFLSGQMPIDPATGKLVGPSVKEQTHQVCKNALAILEAAGVDGNHIVKAVCYLADMADFAEFNEVYAQYFPHKPARVCVAVKGMAKDAIVEMDITAVK